MSTAPAATKAKPSPRSKAKAKSSRAEVNRRNAQKSTGPRTAEGKGHSKYNAVKHGLTARSPLLPGEDADELAGRQRELFGDLQPRNRLEATLVGRIGAQVWRSEQADSAADKLAARRGRHEPREQDLQDRDQALELGARLLWKPSLPIPFEGRTDRWTLDEPRSIDDPVHPYNPARLLLRLESTIAGCNWLLDRWTELDRRLNVDGMWQSSNALKMVRLLGKHAIEMEDNFDVARLLMCSLTLSASTTAETANERPDWPTALVYMLASFKNEYRYPTELAVEQCQSLHGRLGELPLAKLAPAGEAQAREWLTRVIEGEMRRIGAYPGGPSRDRRRRRGRARDRLAYESGPEGDKRRRYVVSNERLMNRTVAEFLKARTISETGIFDFIAADRAVAGDMLADSDQGLERGPEQQDDDGEPCHEDAAADGVMSDHDDDAKRTHVAKLNSLSHDPKGGYGNAFILRNEPKTDCESRSNEPMPSFLDPAGSDVEQIPSGRTDGAERIRRSAASDRIPHVMRLE